MYTLSSGTDARTHIINMWVEYSRGAVFAQLRALSSNCTLSRAKNAAQKNADARVAARRAMLRCYIYFTFYQVYAGCALCGVVVALKPGTATDCHNSLQSFLYNIFFPLYFSSIAWCSRKLIKPKNNASCQNPKKLSHDGQSFPPSKSHPAEHM